MHSSKPIDKIFSFQLPRKILFGVGVSERVGLEAKNLGGKEVLLVTDQTLKAISIPKKIEEDLVKEGFNVDLFSNVEAEPHLEMAEKIAEAARNRKYEIVVGVGGGSVLDMAKVAAMAATNPGPVRRYVGVDLVKKPGLPKILLPTTSGTASEVTGNAVVSLTEEEIKSAVVSPYIYGDVALVDPSLTYTLPPRLTASTGLDALSHALEAVMSTNANPITDPLALQSIRLIFTHLSKAYRSGDAESRYGMSLGSLIAGMAFGNAGVCLGHALAYAFSVSYRVPHGVSCGLALPYAFGFNASAISWKLPQIAEAIGLDTDNRKTEELALSISEAIFRLMDELQAPRRLRDLGVPKEALPKIAGKLLSIERLLQRNPKPLSRESASKLIEEMW